MGVHTGEPDGGSPAEGAADGRRPGLRHLQGGEEERRALLADRQPGGCQAHVLPLRLLYSSCISPPMLVCSACSTSASTASITSRPSTRRWAPRGLSCSRRFPGKRPTRWRAAAVAAWGSDCVRTASTMGACPRPPVPPHCEWSQGKPSPLAPCCTNLPSNGHKLWFDVGYLFEVAMQLEVKQLQYDNIGWYFSIWDDTLVQKRFSDTL